MTAMRRRFNAAEYRDDAMDLIKTNPELAAESVTKLARRKHNADTELDKASDATRDVVAVIGMTAVLAAVGAWNGSMTAKRNALIEDWEANGAKAVGADLTETDMPWKHDAGVADPTMLFFVPKLLLPPLLLGLGSVAVAATRKGRGKAGALERTLTMSTGATFAYFIADLVGGWAYRRKSLKLKTAGVGATTSVAPMAATG